MSEGSQRSSEALGIAGLILLLLFFALLKSFSLGPAVSDENIYFYSAWLMTEGEMPYRDFFFAHPPMHLIPGWLVFELTGFSLIPGKLLPNLASAAAGIGVFLIARRAAGFGAGLAAAALFLLSHDVLRASSHWTGINSAIAWSTLGLLAGLAGRVRLSGVLYALGATTGFYIFPSAVMVACLLGVTKRRDGLRFVLAFAIPFLAVNGIFWGIGGEAYLDGVYRYHLMKPELPGQGLLDQLPSILFHDFFLLMGPISLLPHVWPERRRVLRLRLGALFDPKDDPAMATGRWCGLLALGTLAFLALLGQVFHFYFLLLFPVCAVCGGIFLAWLVECVSGAVRQREGFGRAAALLAVVAVGFFVYPSFEYQLSYFERNSGRTRRYELPPSTAPAPLVAFVRNLIWRPDRTIGERHTGIQYYLWHESRRFDAGRTIADRLRSLAEPGDAIFGDSATTPLIALWSGLPIAARMVDTNGMRFSSGITPPGEAIARLRATYLDEAESLRWVLVHPRGGFHRIDVLRAFIEEDFELVESFATPHHGRYELLRRRSGSGAQ